MTIASTICIAMILLLNLPLASAGKGLTFNTTSTSVVTSPTGFLGLNESSSGFAIAPDPQVAAGPNHIVEIVNFQVAIYTKQGGQVSSTPLSTFFHAGSDFVFDPRVLFDGSSQRWFAIITDNTVGNVRLGVSSTSDPTGSWNFYTLGGAGVFCPDQPRIGINDDKVVISADQSSYVTPPSPGTGCFSYFLGSEYWVLNKSELVQGLAFIDNFTVGPNVNLPGEIQPVQTLGSSTTLFMVATTNAGTFTLWSISGVPPGKVTNSTVSLSFPNAVTAPQLSQQPPVTGGNIPQDVDTSSEGVRVQGSAWFNGKLWFGFNVACTPPGDSQTRTCIHLTQVNTSPISISQDFIFAAKGQYYYFPAMSIDGSGNLDVVFAYSNSTTYPSLAVVGQARNDPANSLSPRLTIKSGTQLTTARFGDYFGAGLDPSDSSLVWMVGEYSASYLQLWSTFIASVRLLPPDFSISANPSSVSLTAGRTTKVTINVTSIRGFSGTITFSATAPSGITTSFKPTSVTLTAGGSATTTLSITPDSNCVIGIGNTITVTGSGSITHKTTITITSVKC